MGHSPVSRTSDSYAVYITPPSKTFPWIRVVRKKRAGPHGRMSLEKEIASLGGPDILEPAGLEEAAKKLGFAILRDSRNIAQWQSVKTLSGKENPMLFVLREVARRGATVPYQEFRQIAKGAGYKPAGGGALLREHFVREGDLVRISPTGWGLLGDFSIKPAASKYILAEPLPLRGRPASEILLEDRG